jgi:ribosomal protein S18 acetylase RimI-like enzyme
MVTLTLRPALPSDLPFLGALCARSTSIPQEGIGYPRCEDETELLAELALYDNKLQDSIRIVCEAASGRPLGFGGFLVSDTDETTYVVGPLLAGDDRTPEIAAEALRRLVGCPVGGKTLVNYVEEDNAVLSEALRETGWRPGSVQLEMRYEVAARPVPPPATWPIRPLEGARDPAFGQVAALLARQHRWTSGPEARLAGYLDDGYRVALTEDEGHLAGCVLWIYLDDTDFGRLDYLSVDEPFQRRGLGTALTRHMLADAHRTKDIEYVYLSLDPANAGAHLLYQGCGFADTVRSRKYVHDRD